ncbi:MAG: carbohydrate binding domain-containing protein [bacterium]|nr:carbohydrate binding domain-containing protein [bacterium]
MRKLLLGFAVIAMLSIAAQAANADVIFDDFESGIDWVNSSASNYWWKYSDSGDIFNPALSSAGAPQGNNYLDIQSTDNNYNYYTGGTGHYKEMDLSAYDSFRLMVKGDSSWGSLKIELKEKDGDLFKYGEWTLDESIWLPINWTGWKEVIIPFSSFINDNPGVGNDTWTGDFVSANFIVSAPAGGSISWGLDDIGATNVVPEPGTIALFGIGMAGLLLISKRKK